MKEKFFKTLKKMPQKFAKKRWLLDRMRCNGFLKVQMKVMNV